VSGSLLAMRPLAVGEFALSVSLMLCIILLVGSRQVCAALPASNRPNCCHPQETAPAVQSSEKSDTLLADAKSLFQQGKLREADRSIRKYIQTHPDSADGHFLLGHILFRQIQAQAREHQLDSNGQAMAGGVKILQPSSSDAQPAEELAKASLAEFTAGARYRDPTAADLKIVAFDYVLLGDYADADKWFTKMLQWTPNDSEGWYFLGRAKYNENRFEEAVSAFEQSLKLDPKNVKAEDNLGLAYAGLSRNSEAAAAFQRALDWQAQAAAKNPGPYIDMGRLLLEESRPRDAVTYLVQAVEIAPRESRAHELLGKAYSRLDELPKAQAELEKAIELSPRSPNLHCMLAPVYRKRGLEEQAKVEFSRCAALTGSHSTPETPRP
jgi:tetratricopeptide (TPR) repeat protein